MPREDRWHNRIGNQTPLTSGSRDTGQTKHDLGDTADTDSESTIRLKYDDQSLRVPAGATAADVKDVLGLPDSETLIVHPTDTERTGRTEPLALHDEDTVATYAADGDTLSHQPLPDHQNLSG